MSIDFSYFLHVYVNFQSTCRQCVSFSKFTIIITTKHSQQTAEDIWNGYKYYNIEQTYVLQLFCTLKTKWALSYANRTSEDVSGRKRSGWRHFRQGWETDSNRSSPQVTKRFGGLKVSCETDNMWYAESQMKYLSTVWLSQLRFR